MEKDSLFYEKLGFNAHPCLCEEAYDGWLLRFADGYTKRANSVSVIGKSKMVPEEKIEYCEEKYAEQGLPTVFKITPMAEDLDGLLEEKGYSAIDKTNVMTMELKQNRYGNDTDTIGGKVSVAVEEKITEAWQYYYFTFNKVSASGISTARKIQAKITNPILCATV